MQFSEQWLRSMVDPALTTGELVHLLTMSGLEVEEVRPVAPEFSGIVVGRVLSVERHPNADKLSVCRVDAGRGEREEPAVIVRQSELARRAEHAVALDPAHLRDPDLERLIGRFARQTRAHHRERRLHSGDDVRCAAHDLQRLAAARIDAAD